MQIKICGIRDPQALEAAIEAGADYAGFIFHPPSPRFLTLDEAAVLTAQAKGRIKRVALIVNPETQVLDEIFAAGEFDVLQLQGRESPERVAELRARYGITVWKAIAVATSEDVARAADYRDAADMVLFDAKTPPGALPGGMGLRFDWTLLAGLDLALPWGLAGGLDPDNVAEAIARTNAPLVDVCSGTECAPGVKDVDKIAAFCKAARSV